MKKAPVFHPFLFAIFPILFLFFYNIGQVSFAQILVPTAFVLSFTFILFLSLSLVLRNIEKAGIITSLFLILFFSYGHIFDIIYGRQIGSFVIDSNIYLMLIWGLLFSCSTYSIIKTRRDLHNSTSLLNTVAFSLVILTLINIGVYKVKTRGLLQNDVISPAHISTAPLDLKKAAPFRDIYYIILDGYARSDTLFELFGYDNHEFTDYLTEKGFYVASKSCCNYQCTFLSLPSSLNMEYINYLREKMGKKSRDPLILMRMMNDNKVTRFLKARGYKFISARKNRHADLNLDCGSLYSCPFLSALDFYEFTSALWRTTILQPVISYFNSIVNLRPVVLCMFSKLVQAQKIEGPKYVFAHFPIPHPPYVFGRNGEKVTQTKSSMTAWEPKWQYLNQLIFVNKKVTELIEKILSESEVAPIIIIQADHGVAFSGNQASERMFKERMRIFNAYFLPNINKDLLYKSITPVNTFRFIFKHYFNANYNLIDDKVYFTNVDESLYNFTDITNKVN